MEPRQWGPHFWKVIDAVALSYPEKPDIQDQNNVSTFIVSLKNVLPCEKCQNHFTENLKKFPISQALNSRNNFIKWVIDVHNSVNKSNGKATLSYAQGLIEMKKGLYNGDNGDMKYNIMMTMVVGIGAFYVFRKTKFFKNLLK